MRILKKLVFIVFFLFLFFSLFRNYIGYRKNMEFYKSYKESVELETKRNTELKTQKLLKTSMREVEKTIRNKLGLLKPNEIAVIIPLPTPSPTPAVTPIRPVYMQWWDTFFRID